ncbi:hypothetical protein BGZ65_007462 [Modicella reniformis]|uniref:BZIP domain-containing protein n=1 Tax=Modicella reniformis TaxID=1440133 RepID=A0A9P6MFK7_9FUNG|nr:hypothetical protein BGZ65_007462 [Modicella reniformis]
MDSYPNPYAALIATFNQVSPLEGQEELEDPQHLADDDLLLWANAQFTYDIPPGVGIYEDDMGVKLAMSQQQFQQTQQHQQQHQQQQQQQQQHQQQQQQQQQQPQQQHVAATSQAQALPLQYTSADMQRQLQQFEAIHRYLDAGSEDPRTSLSVVERSRQRNPVVTAGLSQQPALYNNPIYPQHSHADSTTTTTTTTTTATTSFPVPTAVGPISSAAARLLRQPFLALQLQQQQHSSVYTMGGSPLPSPTTMSDFRQLQLNSPSTPVTTSKPSDDVQIKRPLGRKDDGLAAPSGPNSPAHSITSVTATVPSLSPREEKHNSADSNIKGHEQHHTEFEGTGTSTSSSSDTTPSSNNNAKMLKAIQDLSDEDPEFSSKLSADEDKRRRNTAASARFRHKKRLREQILEKTAKEMTSKSELLEIRVRELEMEIKWLRGLIVEKDSRVLDVGISSAAVAAAAAVSSSSSSSSSSGSGSSKSLSATISKASNPHSAAVLLSLSNGSVTSSRGGSKAEGTATASRKRSKKVTKP